jgi:hypothetical protein
MEEGRHGRETRETETHRRGDLAFTPTSPGTLEQARPVQGRAQWREGRSLTRTSVLGRALDVGADVLIGEGEEHHFLTRMVSTTEGQPAEEQQPTHAPTETETAPEETRVEIVQHKRQTVKSPTAPEFDPRTFKLGPLCKAGHDFSGGQSLLRITTNQCRDCEREKTKRQRTRKAAPTA